MSDREAMQLIFMPGFSTAAAVTNVSGRGVGGLDVVKTNVEKIGGTVEVSSELGVGTTLRVRIPLTLAIIPALLVLGDGDRYAIAQRDVVELVRLDSGKRGPNGVEHVHGAPVYRLRGRCSRSSTSARCWASASARTRTRSRSSCCRPTVSSSA